MGDRAAGARRVAGRSRSLRKPVRRRRVAELVQRALVWKGWANLVAMTTTVAALAALWFTNQSLRATKDQYALSQQTVVTDRFHKAVEHLTIDKMEARLSAVFLLERLAHDSPADHSTIYSVLASFVHTQSPVWGCRLTGKPGPSARLENDVQAVLTVIGRRDVAHEKPGTVIDLSENCLIGVRARGANLRRADFTGTNLDGADLRGADLREADLQRANLANARLDGANLTGANLRGTTLPGPRPGG
ncbi:pentapeptide repeat-containing protein [Nocardia sp. CDC159]|uniref:Pentapeptide repeat-containing protein n=1 Tax=Nocardia pulmonis TaxID=2951408 RepID=A0A9X2EBV1_9NOCA|nr:MULTISPECIES: pentapeptide repeat-containing protein [Nocardia]MCM6775288.1 pentapeptide repeat-containing protein [Nocardia pulmonis]MCM6787978.1 pentapeptide repeat-containing protein [Nocardia sp. CDC159]